MTLCRYLKRASFLCRTCSHVLTTSQSQTRTALIPIPNQKTRRIPLLSSPHFANRVRGGVSSDRCLPCAFSAACILRRSVRRANCIPSNTCRNIGLRFPIEWVWRSETFCPSCRPNKCDCNSREVRSTSTRRQHRRTLSISVSCWRWRYQIGWWGEGEEDDWLEHTCSTVQRAMVWRSLTTQHGEVKIKDEKKNFSL